MAAIGDTKTVVVKATWWSKTMAVNVLTIIAAGATIMVGQEWIKDNPNVGYAMLVILGMINTALRQYTSQPVSMASRE